MWLLLWLACTGEKDTGGGGDTILDGDGDGVLADQDCDDADPQVSPTANEYCDGRDTNCNGEIDEGALDAPTWYADDDGDGFGDPLSATAACEAPAGLIADGADCDDSNADINPGETEICDGANTDENCDGTADGADAAGQTTWYTDADADGFGDTANTVTACDAPAGTSTIGADCDDTRSDIYPGAVEVCDDTGTDEDCDGVADSNAWYADADGDGFGDPAVRLDGCENPGGYVADATDCDDTNAEINPGRVEVCDEANTDENCDGAADDSSAEGQATYYTDADADGFGDDSTGVTTCDAPAGTVGTSGDCDDARADIFPGAAETDCTDPTDYNCDGRTGSVDGDGDGFAACEDCDDTRSELNPDAAEVCDDANTDENCDGSADGSDADGQGAWYADADGDGFGDAGAVTTACDGPDGYTTDNTDCDDSSAAINPGAAEPDCTDNTDYNCDGLSAAADEDGDGFPACEDCDDARADVSPDAAEVCDDANTDENCDGSADGPDASGQATWYADMDGDGFGDAGAVTTACDVPAGYTADAADCDDARDDIFPGATETDCTDPTDYNCDGSAAATDSDGDGFAACEDCDDSDPAIHPGATEVCDDANTDENCDGAADGPDATGQVTWYADADGDGFGDAGAVTTACDLPAGYTTDTSDCDDTNADIFPGSTEVCDAANTDENCDGSADGPDASGQATWYADADGDGFGDADTVVLACDLPAGYTNDTTDCDDTRADVSPGAAERCDDDNTDEDCDGAADGPDATGQATWYADADGDGFGDAGAVTLACDLPAGHTDDNTDCDDARDDISPIAVERCDDDNTDEDCDGAADGPDATGQATWYADADEDGFGDAGAVTLACDLPVGHTDDDTDCDDARADISPVAVERCDAANTDEDCDGAADGPDATGQATWYADADEDGFGDAGAATLACDGPAGYVANLSDCDDVRADVFPGAGEVCDDDNTDEDCDGAADGPDASGQVSWYADADGDGYIDGSSMVEACDVPVGYLSAETPIDCDDSRADVSPDAAELCDLGDVDEDCDGRIDDDDDAPVGQTVWYADADNDGHGDAAQVQGACDQPGGYVANDTDCDDANAAISPDAVEVCSGGDEDCDGLVNDDDPDVSDPDPWYADQDDDGYGDATDSVLACVVPAGRVADPTDCDDGDPGVSPSAVEQCEAANRDEDCDGLADDNDPDATGQSLWYGDSDGDGFGDGGNSFPACDLPVGYAALDTDCDDSRDDVAPDAPEVCDLGSTDEDCDGVADDADASATGQAAWYRDADADGYGDSRDAVDACDAPAGRVLNATDCNDARSDISPGDPEVCDGANTDEDCDGLADDGDPSVTAATFTTFYADRDADTYGSPTSTRATCDLPVGHVTNALDCNDTNPSIRPGGAEVCDSANTDEDCDGLSDDADASATGQSLWYADTDGDGFGISTTTSACDQPAAYVASGTLDCDDDDAEVYPGAPEICNDGVFNGCSASADTCTRTGTQSVSAADGRIRGTGNYDFGQSIGVADFNGDGQEDVVVGEPSGRSFATSGGVAWVFSGPLSASTTVASSAASAAIYGPSFGYCGTSVYGLPDLNADGYDDLYFTCNTTPYLALGPFSGNTAYTSIIDATLSTTTTVASGGQFNTSAGYGYMVLGTSSYNLSRGQVNVYVGNSTGIQAAVVLTLNGDAAYDLVGSALAGGMDMDGDGADDLWVGADGDDLGGTNAGTVYLISGGTTGTLSPSTVDLSIYGNTSSAAAGDSLVFAGDTNADGYADVVIGGASTTVGATVAWLVESPGASNTSVSSVAAASFTASNGAAVAALAAGDVNCDGEPDLLFGSADDDTVASNAGIAWLFYGPVSGAHTLSSADVIWTGEEASDRLSQTGAGRIADLDGDGCDDVAVASEAGDTSPYSDYGALYLFLGRGI